MINMYRKKPIEVPAVELEYNTLIIHAIEKWTGGKAKRGLDGSMIIETLEGKMTASTGDFILKGVNGEFYPCKPDIFHKTYEKV